MLLLKWECENFIEQVKAILEKDSDSLIQKLKDYFGQKEVVSENNKLIHEAILTFFNDKSFDKEKEIINWMLTKESDLIKKFLTRHYSQRIKKTSTNLPNFIVINSWGMFFANKLNSLIEQSKSEETKITIYRIVRNYFRLRILIFSFIIFIRIIIIITKNKFFVFMLYHLSLNNKENIFSNIC